MASLTANTGKRFLTVTLFVAENMLPGFSVRSSVGCSGCFVFGVFSGREDIGCFFFNPGALLEVQALLEVHALLALVRKRRVRLWCRLPSCFVVFCVTATRSCSDFYGE